MDRTASLSETAELPDLDAGLQLLATDVRCALPALVVDHVLRASGRALWTDANGHARTRAVADVAPDRRVLRRIEVARGFTAYQHYAIVDALAERALDAVSDAASGTTDDAAAGAAGDTADDVAGGGRDISLLVAPAIDAPYRDDGLRGDEGREMLARALARLAGVARRLDVPVLVTRTRNDEFAAPVANAADETIRCERTPMGPRFATDEFETLVYPAGDGLVQTTLAFWRRVLERRCPDGALGGAGTAAESGDDATPAGAGRGATGQSALVREDPIVPNGGAPTAPAHGAPRRW